MSKKSNKWIEHIKSFALKNNMSYGCALSSVDAKNSYKSSNIEPKKEPKKVNNQDDYDNISQELQNKIFLTSTSNLVKVLANLGYKGRLHTNPILKVQQILVNFKTVDKMKELLKAL